MKQVIKLITPEYAKKLLQKNNINRTQSQRIINEYARQMLCGLWHEEAYDPIRIADDGTLLDGQHRLEALILAGISLRFMVYEDVDKSSFIWFDIGKKRTAGDVLSISDVKNANNVAAGIKRYLALKSGIAIAYEKGSGGMKTYSNKEILSIYMEREAFWKQAMNNSDNWYYHSGRLLNKSDMLAFYAFFYDINAFDAYTFMEMFAEGIVPSLKHPVRLLRIKLSEAKLNTRFNLTGTVKTALVIKAWNYFRKGESIKLLKYAPETDLFPVAI